MSNLNDYSIGPFMINKMMSRPTNFLAGAAIMSSGKHFKTGNKGSSCSTKRRNRGGKKR